MGKEVGSQLQVEVGARQSVRRYPAYFTALGDTLFPGDDFFALELKSTFGELMVEIAKANLRFTLETVLSQLDGFVPQNILDSSPEWKAREMERLAQETRPKIRKALSKFFLEGGRDELFKMQNDLLDALVDAGIDITGRVTLSANLWDFGDWHKKFMYFVCCGRPEGVTFRPVGKGLNMHEIVRAMETARFDAHQIKIFVHETA